MSNNDFESGSQIWNRFNENIGLTLSIPIFSNRKNRTAVNKAKIAVDNSYLEWTSLQKSCCGMWNRPTWMLPRPRPSTFLPEKRRNTPGKAMNSPANSSASG